MRDFSDVQDGTPSKKVPIVTTACLRDFGNRLSLHKSSWLAWLWFLSNAPRFPLFSSLKDYPDTIRQSASHVVVSSSSNSPESPPRSSKLTSDLGSFGALRNSISACSNLYFEVTRVVTSVAGWGLGHCCLTGNPAFSSPIIKLVYHSTLIKRYG